MTGVLILAGFVFIIMGLGHCILSATLALPFKGWAAATYWIIVGIAVSLFAGAWISHLAEQATLA